MIIGLDCLREYRFIAYLCRHPFSHTLNLYNMEITRADIIARTKTCMEELTPQWNGTFEQTEGVSIERYIDDKIDEQLRVLFITAPVILLPVTELKGQVVVQQRQDGTGRLQMPDNFLRPVSLQMEGWNKPVSKFINEQHPLYELQFSRYTRGGVNKPVAVWSLDGSGCHIIDYFSLPATMKQHTVQSFLGVLLPTEDAMEYELHPLLVDALCYSCAAVVYDIWGNRAMAEVMLARVEKIIAE